MKEEPMKKYELTNNTKYGLHQIRALRDFSFVKAGDLGGWIASESNLSHKGDCWVSGNAQVFDDARLAQGYAFATKTNSWDITEVDNGDGSTTMYAIAVFEPIEAKSCHGGQTGKFCSECGEKL